MRDRAAITGVALMLAVAVMNTADAVIVRTLAKEVHPFVIGWTRATCGAIAILPFVLRRPAILKSNFRFLHVLRATLKLLSLVAVFAALAGAPLADVTAIGFAAPIFVTVGAWLFLSERPNAVRIVGAALGFVGIVVMLRPGGDGFAISPAIGLALLGAVLTAAIQLMLKPMSRLDGADTLVAWNLLVTAPIALLPALWFWTTPTPTQWGLLALQGALGALNQTFVTKAMQLTDASLVAPLDFLRLPFVALAAALVFGEATAMATFAGAGIVFVGIMMIVASARAPRPAPLANPEAIA